MLSFYATPEGRRASKLYNQEDDRHRQLVTFTNARLCSYNIGYVYFGYIKLN